MRLGGEHGGEHVEVLVGGGLDAGRGGVVIGLVGGRHAGSIVVYGTHHGGDVSWSRGVGLLRFLLRDLWLFPGI